MDGESARGCVYLVARIWALVWSSPTIACKAFVVLCWCVVLAVARV